MQHADVGVAESCDGARLALEALLERKIVAEGEGQDLDRDGSIESGVGGLVHLPHAAGAEHAVDAVRPELSADEGATVGLGDRRHLGRRCAEELLGRRFAGQKRLHLLAATSSSGHAPFEVGRALVRLAAPSALVEAAPRFPSSDPPTSHYPPAILRVPRINPEMATSLDEADLSRRVRAINPRCRHARGERPVGALQDAHRRFPLCTVVVSDKVLLAGFRSGVSDSTDTVLTRLPLRGQHSRMPIV